MKTFKVIILCALSLSFAACATSRSPVSRTPSQVGGMGAAPGVIEREKQLAEEDKQRREKPRDQAFRDKNFKNGFPITMKVIIPEPAAYIMEEYRVNCFSRIVEEFLDYSPKTRAINENPDKNIMTSDIRGWSNANNYFTFSVRDSKNDVYKGMIYVKHGIIQGSDYFACSVVSSDTKDTIQMKSETETIFLSSCVKNPSAEKCKAIK